jgi:hypothetical protein
MDGKRIANQLCRSWRDGAQIASRNEKYILNTVIVIVIELLNGTRDHTERLNAWPSIQGSEFM